MSLHRGVGRWCWKEARWMQVGRKGATVVLLPGGYSEETQEARRWMAGMSEGTLRRGSCRSVATDGSVGRCRRGRCLDLAAAVLGGDEGWQIGGDGVRIGWGAGRAALRRPEGGVRTAWRSAETDGGASEGRSGDARCPGWPELAARRRGGAGVGRSGWRSFGQAVWWRALGMGFGEESYSGVLGLKKKRTKQGGRHRGFFFSWFREEENGKNMPWSLEEERE